MKWHDIEIRAGRTQEDVLRGQCDVITKCDTIKDAKNKARYYLTDYFQQSAELSEPLGYSQVVVNGECRYDYFRKENKQ
jgi:hypothetical protein